MRWIKLLFKILGIVVSAIVILVIVLFVSIWLWDFSDDYNRKHYFQNRDRIERITGVALPKFKVTEYHEDRRSFTGDYWDYFDIEFKNALPDSLFDELDKKIEAGNTGWSKEGNKYSFSQTWGNGMPAPSGESDNADRMFGITIIKGSKEGKINHGIW